MCKLYGFRIYYVPILYGFITFSKRLECSGFLYGLVDGGIIVPLRSILCTFGLVYLLLILYSLYMLYMFCRVI